jgi:hypothetical protein
MSKIVTQHEFPPIPSRSHDWSAYRDGTEPDGLVGWGPTEKAAVLDLFEREEEDG